ncbi:MAG: HEAT repeat domain-containing protein [Planctomycetes bacterium]|nr:HEAT repeat domain-containing protein [Planctomycetota bacterium]
MSGPPPPPWDLSWGALELAITGLVLLFWFRSSRAARFRLFEEGWREAARRLGLNAVRHGHLLRAPDLLLAGALDGVDVRILCSLEGESDHPRERFRLAFRAEGLPPEIALGPETLATRLGKGVRGSDVRVGVPLVDQELLLEGPEALVVGLLDERTRGELAELVRRRGGRVAHGALFVEFSVTGFDADEFLGEVRRGAELAGRLSLARRSLPQRLQANAQGDTATAVRQRCLKLLLEDYPNAPETAAALLRAAHDPDPMLRLLAAERLGEEGWDVLRALAESGDVPIARPLAGLGRAAAQAPSERMVPRLVAALDSRHPAVRRLAITELGALRYEPIVARFRAWIATAEPDTVAALLGALARIEGAGAVPLLLEHLAAAGLEVRSAAVRALGEWGGYDAVARLLELDGRLHALLDAGLRRDIASAVKAIQARLGGANPGALSLAALPQDAGALSVAADVGALSPADGPAVPLSSPAAAVATARAAAGPDRPSPPALPEPS